MDGSTERLTDDSMLNLLIPRGGYLRKQYHSYGQLGDLFNNFHEPISAPIGADRINVKFDAKPMVYDSVAREWIPFTNRLFDDIPPTFTFAPRPIGLVMELDYFVRSAGLVKHSFVWSIDSIPRDLFGRICCQTNIDFRGRYTFTPWLPDIRSMGVLENSGAYSVSAEDLAKTYD